MVTMQQVAERAEVSITTVSHVINGTRPVSDAARERVVAAMAELEYQPNRLARSLRRGETNTLGLVLPDITDDFFSEMARCIEDAAFARGYSVFLCNADRSLEKELFYARLLVAKQVDGLVFVSVDLSSEHVRFVERSRVPLVAVDREIQGVACDTVVVDNVAGGRMATEHLLALGHRRIGCLHGDLEVAPFAQRLQGYQQALAEAGLAFDSAYVARGNYDGDHGASATERLLRLSEPPTALVASSDLIAMGATHRAHALGFRVPERLSVVGFDDVRVASLTSPTITTVAQPKQAMGQRALEMLLERIAAPDLPARRALLPVRLIARESTAPCT